MTSPLSPIELVHQAIAAGIFGQIQWNDRAVERVPANPELRGLSPDYIRALLHSFVCAGGFLDERRETRPDWLEENADRPDYYRDFWYRAVIAIPALFSKGLFVEVRLFDDDPELPWVEIVNVHPHIRTTMMTRAYPKRCGKCGHRDMRLATLPYVSNIEYDRQNVRVEIPALSVPQCFNCKAISLDIEATREVSAAFLRAARLLTPEEIRHGREKLGLTVSQFAKMLGVDDATVSRWEAGDQVQQRAMDRLLRVCLATPQAVEFLQNDLQTSAVG